MISERQLARKFPGLWGEVVPMLTPHFVQVFNEAYCRKVTPGIKAVPVSAETDPSRVAEFAFQVARLAFEQAVSFENLAESVSLLEKAESRTLFLLKEYQTPKRQMDYPLSESERAEALLIVENYAIFLAGFGETHIEFSPSLPGSGFVDSCRADLSIGECLYEVKTVDRHIAGKDIRQLLVYLALQAATGTMRWSHAGFLNPRRGLVYEFALHKLIPILSGGRLLSEVFYDLVRALSQRDIQLDSAF